jgi:hypothetical protein
MRAAYDADAKKPRELFASVATMSGEKGISGWFTGDYCSAEVHSCAIRQDL